MALSGGRDERAPGIPGARWPRPRGGARGDRAGITGRERRPDRGAIPGEQLHGRRRHAPLQAVRPERFRGRDAAAGRHAARLHPESRRFRRRHAHELVGAGRRLLRPLPGTGRSLQRPQVLELVFACRPAPRRRRAGAARGHGPARHADPSDRPGPGLRRRTLGRRRDGRDPGERVPRCVRRGRRPFRTRRRRGARRRFRVLGDEVGTRGVGCQAESRRTSDRLPWRRRCHRGRGERRCGDQCSARGRGTGPARDACPARRRLEPPRSTHGVARRRRESRCADAGRAVGRARRSARLVGRRRVRRRTPTRKARTRLARWCASSWRILVARPSGDCQASAAWGRPRRPPRPAAAGRRLRRP